MPLPRPTRLARPSAAEEQPAAPLGPLEERVLEHLWDHRAPLRVREVMRAFPALAYTTVMTTLDRLYRKGLLARWRRGRAYCYQPRRSRDEHLRSLLTMQVATLLQGTGASDEVLSTLVRAVGDSRASALDELESLVRAERERLRATETP